MNNRVPSQARVLLRIKAKRMDAAALASRLGRLAPVFGARPEQISFVLSPGHFFDLLVTNIRKAERRVSMASLYLGAEELERQLVTVLGERLKEQKDRPFQAHVHLDYLRGTRGHSVNSSSVNLLQPLVATYGSQLQVSMYLTPSLHSLGWRKLLVPQRWNEIFGLSHLKVGIFDDTVLITGANFSQSYFTNRADRYVCIHDHPQLAAYFADLLGTISSFSFRLAVDPKKSTAHQNPPPLYFDEPSIPIGKAEAELLAFLERQKQQQETPPSSNAPLTVLIPTLQMAQHHIRQDEQVLMDLLAWFSEDPKKPSSVALASGYFNLAPRIQHLFHKFSPSTSPWRVITASPQSNSFFESKGMSRHIPAAYRSFERAFLRSSHRPPLLLNESNQECIYEYSRPGWSFHVKGLWVDRDDGEYFVTTTVGSSNFGHRSLERDLEAQMFIITNEPSLANRIREEREEVFKHGKLVSISDIAHEGEPSYMVQAAATLFRSFL